ncbi:MAG: hypothetical protein FJ211_07340 [Ignavibacteria bacterium]|nr:hypothetical protein [Ignavibacteria bacterium]
MKQHTKVVWLGYASVFLSIVWGVGIIAAIWARHLDRHLEFAGEQSVHAMRDLKGGRFLYRLGFVLNLIVLLMILWIFISTWVF